MTILCGRFILISESWNAFYFNVIISESNCGGNKDDGVF